MSSLNGKQETSGCTIIGKTRRMKRPSKEEIMDRDETGSLAEFGTGKKERWLKEKRGCGSDVGEKMQRVVKRIVEPKFFHQNLLKKQELVG